MTNSEAREILKGDNLNRCCKEENDALDMAIKALESVKVISYGEALQEAFDKDFKKEQLIKRIEQVRDNDMNVGEYPYNRCIEIIREVMG